MTPDVSERAFEDTIECGLLAYGPDACPGDPAKTTVAEPAAPYGDVESGGYERRTSADYDADLCLVPEDAIAFIHATQPATWDRLKQHHKELVREKFLVRLSSEIEKRGTLDVLRNGVKDLGCKFDLAYFRPATGLNPETRERYAANMFSVVRQLRYEKGAADPAKGRSLDLALFLNGLPIFTAELKNPLTGQRVEDAVSQYRTQRDPREPLFRYGRCLAHFAVDPFQVQVTTHLRGTKTRFLPLNRGWNNGAGNPPVPPTQSGYATSYLWEEIWARDSVLDLVRRFIHEQHEEDEAGRKTGKRTMIFPRYHQLEAVRGLVADARANGPGKRYLVEHSAGSGKSFTIAWLAHRFSTLHDGNDERVFDSVVVVTDRRILDRQLQETIRQLEQTLGTVENIDKTSRQLKEALEAGKQIIVTTIQKFPVIVEEIGLLAGQRFALIVDEAHSGQSGETSKKMKQVFAGTLDEAEGEEAAVPTAEDELEARILAEMESRGPLPNVSMFAFTATPKPRTLELFGTKQPDGTYAPFHLYSMRQAIEEGFILDVLENYTTYQAYWNLLKTIEDDPSYDREKATYLLKSFVELHAHAIDQKVRVMIDHFAAQVQNQVAGKAKAMLVTRSRLHAVRYKLAFDRYLEEKGHPWEALVAFSGAVKDGGKSYTESGMNSEGRDYTIGEKQTAREFGKPNFRFLIAASKFQTGFDQPLLHTMYVDKKLGHVNAVQTLSRLNRTHPDKAGTAVIDFANETSEIQKAFEPYYETTVLSEGTDPNLLYEHQGRLRDFGVFTDAEVDAFAKLFFDPKTQQEHLYAALSPYVERAKLKTAEELAEFRGQLNDYVRLYAFLAQILPFADTDLEKLYVFARHLRRLLPVDRAPLPKEVQDNIDMESYRLQRTSSGRIPLERTGTALPPQGSKGASGKSEEHLEPLSRIIAELNQRFGLNLGPEHKLTVERMYERLSRDGALDASVRVNPRDKARLTFDHRLEDVIQDIVDSNFDLYKKITDDAEFGEALKNALFDEYLRTHRQAAELVKQPESKALEFKSTFRWDLKNDQKNDREITHASLKTIAAFLNTEGGDLLIGVGDDGTVLGVEVDGLGDGDKYARHVSQVVVNAFGTAAATHVDPRMQKVDGKWVCLVSCQRAAEPVYLVWKGLEKAGEGDFYVRTGPGSRRIEDDAEVEAYIGGRWG